MNPFDFIKAINITKDDSILIDEKKYPSFMVNRGLSNFPDTILFANEMNINHHLDGKLQFSFLINTVRKRKRFSKWAKADNSEALQVVKEYYGYSNEKARQALTLLNNAEISELKEKVYKGGKQ